MDLGCLMTPGFSRGIQCHVWPYCSKRNGAERQRARGRKGELGGFGMFNDTWFQ